MSFIVFLFQIETSYIADSRVLELARTDHVFRMEVKTLNETSICTITETETEIEAEAELPNKNQDRR